MGGSLALGAKLGDGKRARGRRLGGRAGGRGGRRRRDRRLARDPLRDLAGDELIEPPPEEQRLRALRRRVLGEPAVHPGKLIGYPKPGWNAGDDRRPTRVEVDVIVCPCPAGSVPLADPVRLVALGLHRRREQPGAVRPRRGPTSRTIMIV